MSFPGFPPGLPPLSRPATPEEQAMARKLVENKSPITREADYREALVTIVNIAAIFESNRAHQAKVAAVAAKARRRAA